ncbi:trigger factor [Pelagicoccus sp. SDUM812002]|uniref:trigger factor n=1 Tax=Pelagicoccus sp. SDUM812002 TaxID=3041266 RepID=UPI00280E8E86|nr:trigger factor [Pelagicoccus sp. SDUM812002]MDQ8184422.1 trigger factor [Pelagicoccus sp. SDUM812002]
MKIDIQDVNDTRKTLAVSFEASEIAAEEAELLKQFSKQAKIPGFRPGKAPVNMIRQRFGKQIKDELRQRVISKAYQDGTKEASLNLINVVDLADADIAADQDAELKFTVDIRPEFEIADYKELPVTGLSEEVSDADVEEAIDRIRTERAEFVPVEREAANGDYVKFSHEGTIDGQPISEIAPEKPVYAKMPQTWEEIGSEHGLIPGLGDGLEGLKTGDKKEIEVEFPADFNVEPLQGKKAVYAVDVQEVRERKLPALDEEFCKAQGVESVEDFKNRVTEMVKGKKTQDRRADIRRQVTEAIAAKVDIPLPESLVDFETEMAMRQVVQNNVRKGVAQDKLEENKEQIHAESRAAASEAVKLQLILTQIATKEGIQVTDEDMSRFIMQRAYQSGQKPDAIVKDLRKDQEQVRRIQSSLLYDKTLEFLVDQAKVSEA